jgi:Na+/H+ antiporter NhaD/arsenite permease-like protein
MSLPVELPSLPQVHWIPVAIFLITYLLIAVESNVGRGRDLGAQQPERRRRIFVEVGSNLDRTAAAFCGAVAMVLARTMTLDGAYQAIDWNTLVFLMGMMILVAHFRLSGFFDWVAAHVVLLARTRLQLLVLLVFTCGILSAFFVNDTICLIFPPIVLAVTERLKLPPVPYVIAVATSSNVGSVMSITGNPQNALIGVSGGFSFLDFLFHLAPVALVGLAINVVVLAVFYRRELFGAPLPESKPHLETPVDRVLLIKCALSASLVLVLWVLNFSFPLVAISVGALIFIIGRVKSEHVHEEVDWTLLVFFASLFVVIHGLETSGATAYVLQRFEPWLHAGPVKQLLGLSGAMLVLSNLVSNVPAVLLLRPVVNALPDSHFIWLSLAATSTLAGNCTPFASVANLIVIQQARKTVSIGFWEFTRVGLVVTLLTSAAAIGILTLEYLLGW